MRWATAAVEVFLLAITFGLPLLDLPLDHIAVLIVADAVANVAMARTLSREQVPPRWATTLALAIQVLLLTALLELTGGPSNPFVVIYGLQIALAALTIGHNAGDRARALRRLHVYGVLIYWHVHELSRRIIA